MKALFAAAALAALPITAGAVTVPVTEVAPGLYYATTGSAQITTDTDFTFEVPVDLEGVTVAVSGTGLPLALDLLSYVIEGVSYPIGAVPGFTDTYVFPSVPAGSYTVSFDFASPPPVPVSVTVSAFGTVPAIVPVPAAGALAAGGIIALGALKARRKKA